jgi:hypothetical protein
MNNSLQLSLLLAGACLTNAAGCGPSVQSQPADGGNADASAPASDENAIVTPASGADADDSHDGASAVADPATPTVPAKKPVRAVIAARDARATAHLTAARASAVARNTGAASVKPENV